MTLRITATLQQVLAVARVCVCVCVFVCVCVCVCIHTHMHTYIHAYLGVRDGEQGELSTYVHLYTCACVNIDVREH